MFPTKENIAYTKLLSRRLRITSYEYGPRLFHYAPRWIMEFFFGLINGFYPCCIFSFVIKKIYASNVLGYMESPVPWASTYVPCRYHEGKKTLRPVFNHQSKAWTEWQSKIPKKCDYCNKDYMPRNYSGYIRGRYCSRYCNQKMAARNKGMAKPRFFHTLNP